MRLARISQHYWQLESGEARHAAYPESFWIPERAEREQLRRGQAARLLFEIEGEEEDGTIAHVVERMWVIVAERVDKLYVGILDNQPASIEPGAHVYLTEGAEVPFGPEHVIDITEPPPNWVQDRLDAPPTRRWPRDDDWTMDVFDAAG